MENLFKSYLIVVVFIQFLEIKRKIFFVGICEKIKRSLLFIVLNVSDNFFLVQSICLSQMPNYYKHKNNSVVADPEPPLCPYLFSF